MRIIFSFLLLTFVCCEKEWTNGLFSTWRTETVVGGEQLSLGGFRAGQPWGPCRLTSPSGDTWTVSEEGVSDGGGNAVSGVTPVLSYSGQDSCGVTIDMPGEDHMGDWTVGPHLFTDLDHDYSANYSFIITTDNMVTDIRLPVTFAPLHYEIQLVPDLEYTGTNIVFEGYSSMDVEALVDTDTFTFHADEISILGLGLESEGVGDLGIAEVLFDFQRTFVHVRIPGGYKSGQKLNVNVPFSANITRGSYTTYGSVSLINF